MTLLPMIGQLVERAALVAQIEAKNKDGALKELLAVAQAAGSFDAKLHKALAKRLSEREAIGSTGPLAGLALPANFNRLSTVCLGTALRRFALLANLWRQPPPNAGSTSPHVGHRQLGIGGTVRFLAALATGTCACECPIGVCVSTGLAALNCGHATGERKTGGDLIRLSTLPTAANTIQYLAGRADGTRTSLARDGTSERQRSQTRAVQDLRALRRRRRSG